MSVVVSFIISTIIYLFIMIIIILFIFTQTHIPQAALLDTTEAFG